MRSLKHRMHSTFTKIHDGDQTKRASTALIYSPVGKTFTQAIAPLQSHRHFPELKFWKSSADTARLMGILKKELIQPQEQTSN